MYKGYASFDYTPIEYRTSDLGRIDVLINTKTIDAFSASEKLYKTTVLNSYPNSYRKKNYC